MCEFYKTMNRFFNEMFISISVISGLALIVGFIYFIYLILTGKNELASSEVTFGLLFVLFCLFSIGIGVNAVEEK